MRRLLIKWLALSAMLFPLLAATALPAASKVNYVALGDSLATGFGASDYRAPGVPNRGYVYRFGEFLASNSGKKVDLTNLAVNGLASSDLLRQLRQDRRTRNAVKKADVLTVSVGGDNLLPAFLYLQQTGDLPGAIARATAGVAAFQRDWPQILSEIRRLNRKADLYVLNLYNPFPESIPAYAPLFALAEPFIQAINAVIQNSVFQCAFRYQVADVYSDFKGSFPDGTPKLCVFTHICDPQPDVHPNDLGYAEIARLHAMLVDEENDED